ncbi:hypothetical protein QE152_g548 [Popillia japonica]|uniref:Uncharacterized protein n=1 Tax=Popillia japonica TaxID=7064 RepID=A0AAW1NII2_POPJA
MINQLKRHLERHLSFIEVIAILESCRRILGNFVERSLKYQPGLVTIRRIVYGTVSTVNRTDVAKLSTLISTHCV